MIEVEQVRELLKEVTPGEWLTENRPGQNGFVYALNADGVNRMFAGITAGKLDSGERAPEAESHANARLIAAAPDLAALVLAQAAEIARLQASLRAVLDEAWDGYTVYTAEPETLKAAQETLYISEMKRRK